MNHEKVATPFYHDSGLSPDIFHLFENSYTPECVLIPSAGEVYPEKGASIINTILRLRNISTRIGIDETRPAISARRFPGYIRKGVTGVLQNAFPEIEPVQPEQTTEIFENLMKSDSKVDIVITGPATDVARLIDSHGAENVKKHVGNIYMMGGAIDSNGNEHDFDFTRIIFSILTKKTLKDRSKREWNVMVDPLSVDTIIHSGIPFTLVPLDAVNNIVFDTRMYDALMQYPQTSAQVKLQKYTVGLQQNIDTIHQKFPLWDSATFTFMQDTNLGTIADLHVSMITDPYDSQFGRMMRDPQHGETIRVCTFIVPDRMRQQIVRNIRG